MHMLLADLIVYTYFALALALILALAALVDAHNARRAAEQWRALEAARRMQAESACWEMAQAFATAVRQAIACERDRIAQQAAAETLAALAEREIGT